MKKEFVFLILFTTIGLTLFAQDSTNIEVKPTSKEASNNICLMLGWSRSFYKDLNFSPLNYEQNGLVYSLSYLRKGINEKFIFNASIDFLSNDLKTSNIEFFTSNIIIGNLRLSYLRKTTDVSKPFQFYLGGEFQTNVNYINYNEQDAFSFLIGHNLNLKARLGYQWNEKSSFYWGLSIPIAALVVRPPYNSFDEELQESLNKPLRLLTNGKLMTLNQYQSVDLEIGYYHQLSSEFKLNLKYEVLFQNLNYVSRVLHLQHQIKLGAQYQF